MEKEKSTIKEHIAKQFADKITIEIKKWNNGETLYETEVFDFMKLLEKELLYQNGYDDKQQRIEIPFSENDLEELQNGESFNWNFDGIEVYLFKED